MLENNYIRRPGARMGCRNSLHWSLYCTRDAKFRCSVDTDNVKRSFYRACNGIFAKIGRLASEDVVVQLLKHKCLPILLYALEACKLDRRTMQLLDFTLNRFFHEVI